MNNMLSFCVDSSRVPLHVVCSGYFNPLHAGHLDYLEGAARLGQVTVLVNNDEQVLVKGSCPFMKADERLAIVKALRCVHRAYLSIDTGPSVSRTLAFLHGILPVHKFVNAADATECREAEACQTLGIEVVHLEGPKRNSSSRLIADAMRWYACRT